MAAEERIIPGVIHDDGSVHYSSIMSPSDDSIAVCHVVPNRVIPVIFVPGIMGSNLQNMKNSPVWVVDSGPSMLPWAAKDSSFRKRNLNPASTTVFDGGDLPKGTTLTDAQKAARGWGTVSKKSYGEWLVWLQSALDDCTSATKYGHDGLRCRLKHESAAPGLPPLSDEQVALSYRYQMPVHAVGYNWLQSNAEASQHLADEIDRIISDYGKTHRCEKVILVTHSMRGLVARHCSEALGYKKKIFGIVHGVMPATGSSTAYKRVKAGWESDGSIIGGISQYILGATAKEITAVFAQSAGALQLLPSADYGNGWLNIVDGDQSFSLPRKGDPYTDIYLERNGWWGLIDREIMNPLDVTGQTVDKDWKSFADLIGQQVIPFHVAIAGKYHTDTYVFYGDSKTHRTWGDVVWKRMSVSASLNNQKYNGASASSSRDTRTGTITVSSGNTGSIAVTKSFQLQPAAENGDGTVPIRSGRGPASYVKACIAFDGIDHEGAYSPPPDIRSTRLFALWAITKLVGNVKGTVTMEYAS